MSGKGKHAKVGIASRIEMAWKSAPEDAEDMEVLAVAQEAYNKDIHPREVWGGSK